MNSAQSSQYCIAKLCMGTQWVPGMIGVIVGYWFGVGTQWVPGMIGVIVGYWFGVGTQWVPGMIGVIVGYWFGVGTQWVPGMIGVIVGYWFVNKKINIDCFCKRICENGQRKITKLSVSHHWAHQWITMQKKATSGCVFQQGGKIEELYAIAEYRTCHKLEERDWS